MRSRWWLAALTTALTTLLSACSVYLRVPSHQPGEQRTGPIVIPASADALTFALDELPGDWTLQYSRPIHQDELDGLHVCLPETPPGQLRDGWTAAFDFELSPEGVETAWASVQTARFAGPEGRAETLAWLHTDGIERCVNEYREHEPDLDQADAAQTVQVPFPAMHGAQFRTTIPWGLDQATYRADSVYLVTDDTMVWFTVAAGNGDPSLLTGRLLKIIRERMLGGAPVATRTVTPIGATVAPVDLPPGRPDATRLTNEDVQRFVAVRPPGPTTPCPLVSDADLAAAAASIWDRWQPTAVPAQVVGGMTAEGIEYGVQCSWNRTDGPAGQLNVVVLAADLVAQAAAEDTTSLTSRRHDNGVDTDTWGRNWCTLRDQHDVVVRFWVDGSVVSEAETWQLCDAVLPQARAAVLAG